VAINKPVRKPSRLLLFLYSTPNIVGSILGLIGLGLFFLGIVSQFWLLIVIGMYVIGVLATPKNPTYDLKLRNQLTIEDIRAELENMVRRIHNKLPKEVLEKVISIKNSIVEVLPQIADLSSGDYNIFLIQQTALDYLPAALESYLNLPTAYANFHPVKDGKTAKQLLLEQLDLLDGEMKEVVQEVYRKDTEQLVAHGRFLQEKFQKSLLEP
jgi:hypothetical protein